MGKWIRSEVIPGTVEHFRGLMQMLGRRHAGVWVSSTGERLLFVEHRQRQREIVSVDPLPEPEAGHGGAIVIQSIQDMQRFGSGRYHYRVVDVTLPTRSSWEVDRQPEPNAMITTGYASIEAYEQPTQNTRLDFLDGQIPLAPSIEHEPIGPAFAEFAEMVIREARVQTPPDRLDPLDRKIIDIVRELESGGLKATDELVATRLPRNPKTGKSYHRVTINKRRCKLRDRGYEV